MYLKFSTWAEAGIVQNGGWQANLGSNHSLTSKLTLDRSFLFFSEPQYLIWKMEALSLFEPGLKHLIFLPQPFGS